MITDAIGYWEELGIVDPLFDDWKIFPVPLQQGPGKTFKAVFTSTDWSKKGNSWLWIRYRFINGNTSLSQRIYPRETPVIFEMPCAITVGSIYIECRKGKSFYLGVTPHIPWLVELQELIT